MYTENKEQSNNPYINGMMDPEDFIKIEDVEKQEETIDNSLNLLNKLSSVIASRRNKTKYFDKSVCIILRDTVISNSHIENRIMDIYSSSIKEKLNNQIESNEFTRTSIYYWRRGHATNIALISTPDKRVTIFIPDSDGDETCVGIAASFINNYIKHDNETTESLNNRIECLAFKDRIQGHNTCYLYALDNTLLSMKINLHPKLTHIDPSFKENVPEFLRKYSHGLNIKLVPTQAFSVDPELKLYLRYYHPFNADKLKIQSGKRIPGFSKDHENYLIYDKPPSASEILYNYSLNKVINKLKKSIILNNSLDEETKKLLLGYYIINRYHPQIKPFYIEHPGGDSDPKPNL